MSAAEEEENVYVRAFRAAAVAAIQRQLNNNEGILANNTDATTATPKRRTQTYAGKRGNATPTTTPSRKGEELGEESAIPGEYRTDLKVRMLQFVDGTCESATKLLRMTEGGLACLEDRGEMEPLDEDLVKQVTELDRRADELAERVRRARSRVPKLVANGIPESIERERQASERLFASLNEDEGDVEVRENKDALGSLDREALQATSRRIAELISNLNKRLPIAKDKFESALAASEEARASADTTIDRIVNNNSLLVSDSVLFEVDPGIEVDRALAEGLEGRYAM